MAAVVAKTHFYIGTGKHFETAVDYASDTWTEVLGVTDLGEVGDTADEIKYNVIGEGRTRKLAGTQDAGDFTITAARDNKDPGQAALNAAAAARATVNFKAETDDGAVLYFAGPVLQSSTKFGQANSVVEKVWKVAVTVKPVEA